jgi:alcohol dehydrogenase (NADP+)
MTIAHGYAAHTHDTPMAPYTFERRALREDDVEIRILQSGVCHSDLHTIQNDWSGSIYPNGTIYPSVPGHEIIGRVVALGSAAPRYAVGDIVGVGTMVDSCGECSSCRDHMEPYCENAATWTYNAPDRVTGESTLGGYSDLIVVKEKFVLRVTHREEQLAGGGPILCAGITMWSPLTYLGAGPGKKVGIVGIGGLGHMGLKLARALGAEVVAFTTSPSKAADAKALGAHEVVVSKDAAQMAAQAGSFDIIVDTIAVPHDLDLYLGLLKREGTLTLVGIPADPHPSPAVATLIGGRRNLSGSLVGGLKETQEMLDFCAAKDIVADIEPIAMRDIQRAFDRMVRNDVKYRFVIDMETMDRPA